MRKLAILLCVVTAFTACSKERVSVSGKIANATDSILYLEEVDVYSTLKVDSVKLSKSGRFSFRFKEKISGFYQLRIPKDKIIVLFPNPGDRIKVNADAKNLVSSVEINGSHDTEQISKLIKMLNETRARLDSVAVIYDKTADDTARAALKKEFNSILEKHRRASVAYLLTHYNSLSSLYAIYQQYAPGKTVSRLVCG